MSQKKYFENGTHPGFSGAPKKKSALGMIFLVLILIAASVGGFYLLTYLREKNLIPTKSEQTASTPAESPDGQDQILMPPPPKPVPQPVRNDSPAPQTKPVAAVTTPPQVSEQEKAVRERFTEIDKISQNGDFAKAQQALSSMQTEDLAPRFLAAALYRSGILYRHEKKENETQNAWKTAAQKYPDTQAGRMSALALADTWFVYYAQENNPVYDKWEAIQQMYSLAIGMDGARFIPKTVRERIVANLTLLNRRLVFSPAPTSDAIMHSVAPGESLNSIGNHYGINWTAIAAVNHLKSNSVLRTGQRIKIFKGQCFILVDKEELTLTWYLDGKWIARYPCAVGPDNKTPAGTYLCVSMTPNPQWTNPADGKVYPFGHPENILGTRWIRLEGCDTQGLGIHGTGKPESIPGRTSNGCVRLLNKHVEELFGFVNIVNGQETQVRIFE